MTDARRRLPAVTVAERDPTERTIIVSPTPAMVGPKRGYELRVRSHRRAQQLASLVALVVAIGTIVWFRQAYRYFDVCGDDGACGARSETIAPILLVIACAGVVTGSAVVGYLARFSLVGRIWRWARELAVLHAVLVFAWLIVWQAARL